MASQDSIDAIDKILGKDRLELLRKDLAEIAKCRKEASDALATFVLGG